MRVLDGRGIDLCADMEALAASYPVRVEGHLDRPSRALWLVKWLLLVPHYVVLAFLWLAFVLLSIAAFLVLFFGGPYPRGIFDFNLGVLRWTWRVSFYAFAANGTDRYPPFTLDDVEDYPARLEIAYPAQQRHGFPLIGWWIAGLPQYMLAGIFAGSGGAATWQLSEHRSSFGVGLVDVLVFFAVLALLFSGSYPRSIFDLVLGLNRWVLRVGAYAALMVREYPPFRLDTGEIEAAQLTLPLPLPPQRVEFRREHWGVGRILGVVVSTICVLVALAVVAAGAAAIVFDQTQRDSAGYVMTGDRTYATGTYAFVSDTYDLHGWQPLVGRVRIRFAAAKRVFVGIGPAGAVSHYLAGVRREVSPEPRIRPGDFEARPGGAPRARPGTQAFWVASAVGSGQRSLTWHAHGGRWRAVLMNADGSPGVHAQLAAGARFPYLLEIGIGATCLGVALILAGSFGLYLAVRRR